jgi:NADH:ubiquinone reductase (H+-translocating)
VAASLGVGRVREHRHRDLGFVVDLGGMTAVANPLHVALHGPVAAVTRAYHLYALPSIANRARVLTDWALDATLGPQVVGLTSPGWADGRPRRRSAAHQPSKPEEAPSVEPSAQRRAK